jgi:hypothetical protein
MRPIGQSCDSVLQSLSWASQPAVDDSKKGNEVEEDELKPNAEFMKQKDYLLMYPRYEKAYVEKIRPRHKAPEKVSPVCGRSCVPRMSTDRKKHLPRITTRISVKHAGTCFHSHEPVTRVFICTFSLSPRCSPLCHAT